MASEFEALSVALRENAASSNSKSYFVPRFLIDDCGGTDLVDVGNPFDFYLDCIDRIKNTDSIEIQDGTTYSSFIRFSASLNFELGTALKQIAFLPYLKKKLFVNRIIFLPTSEIGVKDRKGDYGSPFAVKDPFRTEPTLADPLLPNVTPTQQYQALIEACKSINIVAGSIVPLATLAVDADVLSEQPALTYWWRRSKDKKMYRGDLPETDIGQLTNRKYSSLFFDAHSHDLELAQRDEPISIVNALPDPMVADPNSYTWSDVVSVRYSVQPIPPTHGNGPCRVWDYDLPAFELMPNILTWRNEVLGEKVFLLDVANSVPGEVLRKAKLTKCQIIGEYTSGFIASNDEIGCVTGPFLLGAGAHWANPKQHIEALYNSLVDLANEPLESNFFVGISNHDTRPAPQIAAIGFLAATWLLPGSVPFIYSGSEFGNLSVTNCEFGYSSDETQAIQESELSLFSGRLMDWNSCENGEAFLEFLSAIRKTAEYVRARLKENVSIKTIAREKNAVSYSLGGHADPSICVRVYYNRGPEHWKCELPKLEKPIFQVNAVTFSANTQTVELGEFSALITLGNQ